MKNHLVNELSPYLLQHADNPVDWYPWGEEAFARARAEDKPIFLSIGYAACHWCHVMERESFSDPYTAQYLNDHFISIKVDREERPDVDRIYMNAVTALTGQGGWPLSVFITPDGKPFYGGTYFPPTAHHNLPGFVDLLTAVAQQWQEGRSNIEQASESLHVQLEAAQHWGTETAGELRAGVLKQALDTLLAEYDWKNGGWGKAPKFPQAMALEYLLTQASRGEKNALAAARHALQTMQRGGIYDVVNGGFHRYSTDSLWQVPHYEKMLYDNAQLALVYLHAWLLSGEESFRRTSEGVFNFMMAEMMAPDGGFYSSLDADSEGEEGKYYRHDLAEILRALNGDGLRGFFQAVYPLRVCKEESCETVLLQRLGSDADLASGLNISEEEFIAKLDRVHAIIGGVRSRRARPALDDKILLSWNGLAVWAFAEAGRFLDNALFLQVAQKGADFLLKTMRPSGSLCRIFRRGVAKGEAQLEDYASLVVALVQLYQADGETRWIIEAKNLSDEMIRKFSDPAGGFFDTSSASDTIMRTKESQDNVTPSGNAFAVYALELLGQVNEGDDRIEFVRPLLAGMQGVIQRYPLWFSFWLRGLDLAVGPAQQAVLLWQKGDDRYDAMRRVVNAAYRPRMVFIPAMLPLEADAPKHLGRRTLLEDRPTLYFCEGFVCKAPVNTVEGINEILQGE